MKSGYKRKGDDALHEEVGKGSDDVFTDTEGVK